MRVLFFAAHPDDVEFAAGGVLLRLCEHHDVTICTLTDGGAGTHGTSDARKREQQAAAKYAGATLVWRGGTDCSVEYTRAAALELAQLIREHAPDIVLSPHWDQRGGVADPRAHPDHRHLGLLLRDAARFARFRIPQLKGEPHLVKHVWYYMLPHGMRGSIAIPVDDLVPRLRELWACHASQLALRDGAIVNFLLQTRALAAGQLRDVKYAEILDSEAPIPVDVISELFAPPK